VRWLKASDVLYPPQHFAHCSLVWPDRLRPYVQYICRAIYYAVLEPFNGDAPRFSVVGSDYQPALMSNRQCHCFAVVKIRSEVDIQLRLNFAFQSGSLQNAFTEQWLQGDCLRRSVRFLVPQKQ
jgi:hypothetical protein